MSIMKFDKIIPVNLPTSEVVEAGTIIKYVERILIFLAVGTYWRGENSESKKAFK